MSKAIDLTGRPQSEWYSNPNLLDNWYFADPIDQRQGYVVPPGTAYYSDTGLSTQAGTVSAYTEAVYVNGTYGTITVNSTAYYVAWSGAERGYVNPRYTIDRWHFNVGVTSIIGEDGIQVSAAAGLTNPTFFQVVSDARGTKAFLGREMTFSVLADGVLYSTTAVLPEEYAVSVYGNLVTPFGAIHLLLRAADFIVVISTTPGTTVNYQAAKLELGSVQTLAVQDADGRWVLNDPPPNKQQELAKCQRYFYRMKTRHSVKVVATSLPVSTELLPIIFHPSVPMRIDTPAITTETADTLTYTTGGLSEGKEFTKLNVFAAVGNQEGYLHVGVNAAGTFVLGTPYSVLIKPNKYVDFDANL